jgi:HemY protein
MSLFFRHRRAMKGYSAITRGLVAIGAGDQKLARRAADDAARLSPNEALTLLLNAQAAQMSGDAAAAERAFREMARRDDTKLLGLRGLYIEAQRRNDAGTARRVAEEAVRVAPALPWAGQAVLDDRCAASDWGGALDTLETMKAAMEKSDYRRKRAVLLTARAIALDEIERDTARAAVLEAVRLAPDLVPAAALAGRRLTELGEQRKARRILEHAWEISPHPDLAEAYVNLKLGDSARERLARVQKLADKVPGQLEGALAVARVAAEAHEFDMARKALAPYVSSPTRRVATLMAEIEEAEHGDTGRVREWMARAMRAAGDPVWTADGVVSDRWLPVTPNGRLDGFEWRVPLAELGVRRPVIEMAQPEPPAPTIEIAPASPEPAPEPTPAPVAEVEAAPEKPAPKAAKPAAPPPEPIIPLVHAPDDPGPDGALDGDLAGEPGPGGSGEAWRMRQRLR